MRMRNATRRWGRNRCTLYGVWAVLLASFLWSVPIAVAHTGLRGQVLALLLPDFQGAAVKVGAADLGWFQTIKLHDVDVYNARGDLLLRAETISTDTTLLWLICNGGDVKTVVDAPQRRCFTAPNPPAFRPSREEILFPSNAKAESLAIEENLPAIHERIAPAPAPLPSYNHFNGVQFLDELAVIAARETKDESLVLQFHLHQDHIEVMGTLKGLSAESLDLLLRTVVYDADISGTLFGEFSYHLYAKDSRHVFRLREITSPQLVLRTSDRWGYRKVVWKDAVVSGTMVIEDDFIKVEGLRLQSGTTRLNAIGHLPAGEMASLWATVREEETAAGRLVTLDQVARHVPSTLRVASGAAIGCRK